MHCNPAATKNRRSNPNATASNPSSALADSSYPTTEQLKALPGFAELQPEQLAVISTKFSVQQQPMGEALLHADAMPSMLFLLQSGELRQLVNHPSEPGRSLTLALHTSGFIAGWASLQAGQPLE